MKMISQPDSRILKLIQQDIPADQINMKKSVYALTFEYDQKVFLFHTMSRELIELDGSCPEAINTQNQMNDELKYLISHHFFVREDIDEYRTYCSVISLLRMMKQENGYSTYTILPTTYCNARCFYCYELDYHFTAMDQDKTDQLIQFILNTHQEDEILLRWFGGEPLLGKQVINQVCSALKENNVSFRSFMVTNGFLFNESIVSEAVNLWNLKTVQITLDGDEEEYNRRKNYFDKSISPFGKLTENIALLKQTGIKVRLRINMDFENIESVRSLCAHLDQLFPDKSGLGVYVHPLFLTEMSSRCNEIWEECMKMEDLFEEKGFAVSQKRGMEPIRLYYCIASNPSCVSIGADGLVYSCEHCHKESLLGNMEQNDISRRRSCDAEVVREKCRTCPFLPECTEFADCPDLVYDCRSVHKIRLLHTLKKKI